ncbi:hypothetical protein STEG23_009478 [Scotinomys teguina]
MGIPKDGLQNLANTLEGDKDLNSPRELSAEAEKELALVEKTIREAHMDRVNPELKCILVILPSRHSPTGILMQREDVILEWIFLPRKPNKKLKTYIEKISDLIHKGNVLEASEFHKKHHVNSKGLKKDFVITCQQAKDIVKKCPTCSFYNQTPLPEGSNPKGIQRNEIWQMDVFHFMEFGRLKIMEIPIFQKSEVLGYPDVYSRKKEYIGTSLYKWYRDMDINPDNDCIWAMNSDVGPSSCPGSDIPMSMGGNQATYNSLCGDIVFSNIL